MTFGMFRFLSLMILAGLFGGMTASCDKVDLPKEEEENKETPQRPTTDPTTPDNDNDTKLAYTIAEAQSLFSSVSGDTVICVAGYIVGASGSFSLANAEFTAPFSVASNLLLADRRGERDVAKCFPVRLLNGSDMRSELNLAEHPEWLGTAIAVEGPLEEYFRVAGIKNVYNWNHIDIETPTDTTQTRNSDAPIIDHEPQLIWGGRSVRR